MENYITRRGVIERARHELLRELYLRSQPSVDIDTHEFTEEDKQHFHEWHYLPAPIESQLVEDYLAAYAADDQMKLWFEQLIVWFKEGGYRTAYKDIFGTGEKVRTGEPTEKLDELIGPENAEKVYKLMKDFMDFYRTNLDEQTIRSTVMQGPTYNPKTVEEHWGIKVNDDVYKADGEWDYTYQDYINGKVTYQPEED